MTTTTTPTASPPPTPPSAGVMPRKNRFNWSRMWVVARTDLRSLLLQRDFWLPMALLGSFFFVIFIICFTPVPIDTLIDS